MEENSQIVQSSPKAKGYKKFIFLGVVTIIGILLLMWFLVYNKQKSNYFSTVSEVPTVTPDSTVGWKTYTNIPMRFSIKYPPNYPLSLAGSYDKIIPSFRYFNDSYAARGLYIDWEPDYYLEKGNRQDFFDLSSQGGNAIINRVINGKNIYFACQLLSDKKYLQICNQMLSTVRVIDSNADILYWKEYDRNGMYFYYPREWILNDNNFGDTKTILFSMPYNREFGDAHMSIYISPIGYRSDFPDYQINSSVS